MIRLAETKDLEGILKIKEEAVAALKKDGVNQWQDGYPNYQAFLNDINKKTLYVYEDGMILGVCNLSFEIDPSYDVIHDGEWLTDNSKYLVIHRIAVGANSVGKGIAASMFNFARDYARKNNAKSIKIDTHINNFRMRNLLIKLGFIECGKIFLLNYYNNDNMRLAYELIIDE